MSKALKNTIKLGDTIDVVADFGADPTGVRDSTSAIQAAINYAASVSSSTNKVSILFTGAILLFTSVTLASNIALINGTFVGGQISGTSVSNVDFIGSNFLNSQYNSVSLANCQNVNFSRITGSGAGVYSGGINTSYQGFFVYATGCNGIVVTDSPGLSGCEGQGAVGLFNSRNCRVSRNTIHDTWLRGVHTYGTPTDGITTPLRHVIDNNVIYNTGAPNTSSSAIGENGIYASATGTSGLSFDNHFIHDNHIFNVGENGIEVLGGGRVINNTVNTTQAFGGTTPSIEGIYASNFTLVRGNTVSNASGAGIKTTTSFSNISILENQIFSPGQEGINATNYTSTSERASNFKIVGNYIESPGAGHATTYVNYTSTGVTTFDGSCYYSRNTSNLGYSSDNVLPSLNKDVALGTPTIGVWYRGQSLKNAYPSGVNNSEVIVCTQSGNFDTTVSLTGTITNGTSSFTLVASIPASLVVGDVLSAPSVGSSSDNTAKVFTITGISGTTIYVDKPIYGTSGTTATLTMAVPVFSSMADTLNVGSGTTGLIVQPLVGGTNNFALYNASLTPSLTNYALRQDNNGATYLNSSNGHSVSIGVNNATNFQVTTFGATTSQVNTNTSGRTVSGASVSTVVIPQGIASTYVSNASTCAVTVNAPTGDGERRRVVFANAGTVSWAYNTPATAGLSLPTTVTAGQVVEMVYNSVAGTPTNSAATTWYLY